MQEGSESFIIAAMARSKICVLASGGTDSSVLLEFYAGKGAVIYPLYIRHGFLWEKAEIHALRKLIKALDKRSIRPLTAIRFSLKPLLKGHWSMTGENTPSRNSKDAAVFLPARNLLLLWLAGLFCRRKKIGRIALGTLRTNPFQDSTPEFFDTMEKILKMICGRKIRIERPFRRLAKEQVLRFARRVPLEMTFSCLDPRGLSPCGKCNKCAERKKALKAWRQERRTAG